MGIPTHSHLELADDVHLKLGTSADAYFYHNGSNTYLGENGVGALYIQGQYMYLQAAGGDTYIDMSDGDNGRVRLFYDNSVVLSTTSAGVEITGSLGVGTGTDGPDNKLHVEFANTDTSFSGGGGGDWGSEGIRIENTSSTTDTMAMLQFRNSDADIHIAGIRKGTDDSDLGFFFEGTQKVLFENSGDVSLTSGALSISSDGSNAATLTESASGTFTVATVAHTIIDSGGDITLDAGGNDIRLFKAGTEYGKFKSDSSNLSLYSSIQDKDILFKGNDGGSTITALTLDMSNGGSATFNDDVDVTGSIKVTQNIRRTVTTASESSNTHTMDLTLNDNFNVTATNATNTLALTVASENVGQSGMIVITNPASVGSLAFAALPSYMLTPDAATLNWVTSANAIHIITYYVHATDKVLCNYVGNFS